jgi:hypothetical protein
MSDLRFDSESSSSSGTTTSSHENLDYPCNSCRFHIRELFRQADELDEKVLEVAVREHQTSIHVRGNFAPRNYLEPQMVKFAPIEDACQKLQQAVSCYNLAYLRADPDLFSPRNVLHFLMKWTATLDEKRQELAYEAHRVAEIEAYQMQVLADGAIPGMNDEDLKMRRWYFLQFLAVNDWRKCQRFKNLTEEEVLNLVLP